ncbi:uncharacterized protein LOC8078438 isoform X2 [Sorghum bicolor]|uniref:uncharacterized protein LOC8078438 isoform X2 n=1 Tax=Sorghum bicolor TaxID=4558 RepID=UPI000B423680|nr:uncharacterized protein LOC8078438 isoform X2 [Sorghum bicolor]|eukprot:XP_021309412.1 uncharacterized protein LOC8078438 isoform X2 [Sorghum bicolor]
MRRQARGSGGCQATTPLLAVRRRKRGSAPPSSSPSSGQPPQCLIPLGTLCSFARRNPRSLCGGCSGGETQRLDLMVQEGQDCSGFCQEDHTSKVSRYPDVHIHAIVGA